VYSVARKDILTRKTSVELRPTEHEVFCNSIDNAVAPREKTKFLTRFSFKSMIDTKTSIIAEKNMILKKVFFILFVLFLSFRINSNVISVSEDRRAPVHEDPEADPEERKNHQGETPRAAHFH
jgi:hypothetical protein